MKYILFLCLLFGTYTSAQETYQLDTTFGNNGVATVTLNNRPIVKHMAILSDGKVLVGGYYSYGVANNFVVRINSSGTIDTTFGNNGIVFLPGNSFYLSIYPFSDNSFLLSRTNDGLKKFLPNGALDTSFGNNGAILENKNCDDVIILADDQFVTTYKQNETIPFYNIPYKIERYYNNGFIDYSFISNNTSYGEINKVNFARLLLQSDGKINVIQKVSQFFTNYTAHKLFKLNSDGSVDQTTNPSSLIEAPTWFVGLQNDGKLLVQSPTSSTASIMKRYHSDLTVDTSYGTNGVVVFQTFFQLTDPDATLTPDHKLVDISNDSYYYQGSPVNYFRLHRLNSYGFYDNTFGESGIQILPASLSYKLAESVKHVSNSLYISGRGSGPASVQNDIFVAKLNLNTSLNNYENNTDKGFSFYPNPATNSIVFNTAVSSISVYSLDGKLVFVDSDTNEIKVSSLANGIYLLKGITADGKQFDEKLIKN